MIVRWSTAILALALALVLAGCGGGADRTKANVRLVNASSGYTQLDMRVDNELRQGGVGYGETASYIEVDPGKASTTLSAPGSATALLSFTPAVSAKKYYTVLAYGPAGALKQVLLDEAQGDPDTGRAYLRIVNGASDVGAVDLYLTGSSDTLATSVPVQSSIAVDAVVSYLNLFSGTYRLRVTAAGSKTDVRLDVPTVTLASKQVATFVLGPAAGGVLAQGLLIGQQGAITRLDATQARVRVATGLAQVAVRLGSTSLLAAIEQPSVSDYTAATAGSQTLVVSVNGAALASSVKSLTPGRDYTLLVHGTSDSPLVAWIDDDNSVPTDRTQAKVRLVNGVSGVAGALSMTVNNTAKAANVAVGTASDYTLQAPTVTARIVIAATGAGTLFTATDQTFAAGGGYTMFLVGASGNPSGFLQKDR